MVVGRPPACVLKMTADEDGLDEGNKNNRAGTFKGHQRLGGKVTERKAVGACLGRLSGS